MRHDRKFFLPETALVLKNSIRELNEFNAQKAIGAFESISQYANNLFTKPWRKEFRILKVCTELLFLIFCSTYYLTYVILIYLYRRCTRVTFNMKFNPI